MCAGADCIDDVDVVRSGGMKTLFGGVYAPSTVGTLLREFTFGHARQLESVLREHLVALCERVDLLPGADQRVFIDIDSLLRPVYGHAKQGASYGHTKIAGKQVLRKGLSPLATTISTPDCAPLVAGMRLRAGKTGSGKGAGRMVAQAIGTARAVSAHATILVRGDSLWVARGGGHVRAPRRPVLAGHDPQRRDRTRDRRDSRGTHGHRCATPAPCKIPTPAPGSLMPRSPKSPIPRSRPPPMRSPPDWWCAASKTPAYLDALFPVWRYHPFFTNTDLPVEAADITHRQHAIIETTFADLIDGPLAHLPSGRFGANSAWILCAAIAHNLLRAAGVLAGDQHTRARGSTLRRKIINVAARLSRPQRRPMLHLPTHWPWSQHWLALWHNTIGYSPPITA